MKKLLVLVMVCLVVTLVSGQAATAAEARWAHVNDVTLRYKVTGSGPDVIVLLPSTGKPLEYWDEFTPMLMKGNRTVLAYDLRGIGLSQRLKAPITMQDEVNDLKALLDRLGFTGPVTMIGTAFGGSVQINFAAQFPARVRSVVNVSPSAELHGRPKPNPDIRLPDISVDHYAITYPVELRTDTERFERYKAFDASNDAQSKQFTERLIYATHYADVMPHVQCPVLMIATTMYLRRTPESVKELAAALPNGSYAVIESGHDAPYQTPELVLPLMQKFLAENGI